MPLTDAVKQAMDDLCSDDEDVRVAAADTLGRNWRDAAPAVDTLVTALTSDYEAEVRGAAAKALGKIPGNSAVAPLINVAANDGELEVRTEAISALGDLKAPEAVGVLLDAITVRETRNVAQVALGRIGDPAVDPLIDRMKAEGADPDRSADELRETNKGSTAAFLAASWAQALSTRQE